MAEVTIAASTPPTATSDIRKLIYDLHGVQVHLESLLNAALMLIDDRDEMDEVRAVLNAALRYTGDVWQIANDMETADGVMGN